MFPSAPMHLFIPIVSIILFTLYLLLPMRIVVIFALAISSPPVPAETTKEKIDGKSVRPPMVARRSDIKSCADCGF